MSARDHVEPGAQHAPDRASEHRREETPASSAAMLASGQAGANQLAALQRSAGNRAVGRLVQRRSAESMLQRHPQHAPEEEEIQRSLGQGQGLPLQRHPGHAPEEEEIQRVEAPAVQRASKKKLKSRMTAEYGLPFAGLSKAMLERVDKILSKLPRSHTLGNAALKDISGSGGIGANTSGYDYGSEKIEMNVPELAFGKKMPVWLYLLLDKGTKWMRDQMDQGAMSDFNIDSARDAELGLAGKREVMAGVSDVLSQERLVDWTVRHEMGHAVDQQIKFMPTRGRLNIFGGWQMHDTDDLRKEVATAFLTKAGFADTEQAGKLGRHVKTLLEVATGCLDPANVTKLATRAKALGASDDIVQKAAAFDDAAAVASVHPWSFADGGGDRIKQGDRMYHVDHYGTWVSYLASARSAALSNYQFSSPGEWFAESYAAFYDPRTPSPARARMPAEVQQWFTANLGPPSSSRAEGKKSSGALADNKGKLGTLHDLDDAVVNALNDPKKTVTVKKSDLPDDLV